MVVRTSLVVRTSSVFYDCVVQSVAVDRLRASGADREDAVPLHSRLRRRSHALRSPDLYVVPPCRLSYSYS